jgi:hypothetical protein
MTFSKVACVALLLSLPSVGEVLLGVPILTGPGWLALSLQTKVTYLHGFYDAIEFASLDDRRLLRWAPTDRVDGAGMVAEVDRFYLTAANSPIPSTFAIVLVTRLHNGEPKQEIESAIRMLRKRMTALRKAAP